MPYFGNNPSPLLLNTVAQNGKEMTLDADADTSITADTDDQIDIKIGGADDFQFTANTFTAQSGSTIAAQALTATTITASGIVKTDDATDATSTTDGSLQTDGGLSVVKDAVFGDDVKLLSDSSVIHFGADSEVTLTHVHDTGLSLNDNLTITTADNDTQLTLISTDTDANVAPTIDLTRDSSSPADDDFIGRIRFRGENDASEVINYAAINAVIKDVTDGTEDGRLDLRTFKAGTERSRILINHTETVFNDDSVAVDVRVESDSDENAFKVAGDTGNIGIGTGAPLHTLELKKAAPELMIEETSSGGSKRLSMGVTSGGQPFISSEQSGGNLNIDLVGTTRWNINQYGTITQSGNNSGSLVYEMNNANGSSPYGQRINFTGVDADNNTTYFLAGEATSNNKFKIFSDGDMANHDNSFGSLSDERIKQDITDANSQWDDIKAVKVRNFKKKDDVEKYGDKAWSQIGVIAQELETVSPKLIKETPPEPSDIKHSSEFGTLYEDGDTIPEGKKVGDVKEIKSNVKKVSYSVLYMKAVKALQEAMTRIETLEAKVKTLEEA